MRSRFVRGRIGALATDAVANVRTAAGRLRGRPSYMGARRRARPLLQLGCVLEDPMRHSFLALAAALALPTLAHADIAPPPGYVEQCTVAKYSSPSRECHACRNYRKNPADCQRKMGDDYQRVCHTGGATTWWEIWCRSVDGGTPAVSVDSGTGVAVDTATSALIGTDAGAHTGDRSGHASASRGKTFVASDRVDDKPAASSDGGCSALGAGDLPLPALLALAGLLASRGRRHPR